MAHLERDDLESGMIPKLRASVSLQNDKGAATQHRCDALDAATSLRSRSIEGAGYMCREGAVPVALLTRSRFEVRWLPEHF